MVEQSVVAQEAEGRYTVLPIAIEAWLKTAIANAEQLLAELAPASPLLEPDPAATPPKKAPAGKKAKRSVPEPMAPHTAFEAGSNVQAE